MVDTLAPRGVIGVMTPAMNTVVQPELELLRPPGVTNQLQRFRLITVHDNENLAPSDKGVALLRRRLRQQIRHVGSGGRPMLVTDYKSIPIPTYGGDSVLTIPAAGDADESAFLSRLAHEFIEVQFAADDILEEDRVAFVTERLKTIEARGHVQTGA